MPTLREELQTKITNIQEKAQADISAIQADMAVLEQKAATGFDSDVEEIKSWFSIVAKHLGL